MDLLGWKSIGMYDSILKMNIPVVDKTLTDFPERTKLALSRVRLDLTMHESEIREEKGERERRLKEYEQKLMYKDLDPFERAEAFIYDARHGHGAYKNYREKQREKEIKKEKDKGKRQLGLIHALKEEEERRNKWISHRFSEPINKEDENPY